MMGVPLAAALMAQMPVDKGAAIHALLATVRRMEVIRPVRVVSSARATCLMDTRAETAPSFEEFRGRFA